MCVIYLYVSIIYDYYFFFNDTATTEIYTLSLHDALPILPGGRLVPRLPPRGHGGWLQVVARDGARPLGQGALRPARRRGASPDRKSTRLNSSHANISYAVFCLKKKKKTYNL